MNNQALILDVSRLPAERSLGGSKVLGVFLTLFSLLWGGIPTIMLVIVVADKGLTPAVAPLLLFTVIGTGLFLGGLNQFWTKGYVRITSAEVVYSKSSLFGRKDWTEPLARYTGVGYRTEYHSGGKNSPSYTLHIVELQHPEKAKCVITWQAKSPDGARAIQEEHCRALKLPALEADGAGWAKRETADLDKSVRELVQERKLTVKFDPRQPPPSGIQLRIDGPMLHLTLSFPRAPLVVALPFMIVGIVFLLIGILAKGLPLFFILIGLLCAGAPAALFFFAQRMRQRIALSKEEVRISWDTPFGERGLATLPADEIEQVELRAQAGSRQTALTLATDTRQVVVGAGLQPEALEWLRQCILAVLTAG